MKSASRLRHLAPSHRRDLTLHLYLRQMWFRAAVFFFFPARAGLWFDHAADVDHGRGALRRRSSRGEKVNWVRGENAVVESAAGRRSGTMRHQETSGGCRAPRPKSKAALTRCLFWHRVHRVFHSFNIHFDLLQRGLSFACLISLHSFGNPL